MYLYFGWLGILILFGGQRGFKTSTAYRGSWTTPDTNSSDCFRVQTPFNGSCWCTPLMDIKCSGLASVPDLHSLDPRIVFGGLYMSGQKIRNLPEAAFSGIRVQKVVLNFNPIGETLSANVLSGAGRDLRELYMGDCKINRVPEKMFDHAPGLTHLHLWANQIEYLPMNLFKSCENLTELILWGNRIESITEHSLVGLWKLRKLDLDRNRISSIHPLAFRHLANVRVIHLGENRLTNLRSSIFCHANKLRVLNLDRNKIDSVYSKAFEGLNNLISLALNHNNISLITAETFTNLKNLTTIYLHENFIRTLWPKLFSHQKSLYLLNLSNNLIESLPDGILRQNHHLKILHLSNNELQTIQRCVFPTGRRHSTSLKMLSLQGNNISCDCRMAWLFDVHKSSKVFVWGICGQPYPGSRLEVGNSPVSVVSPHHYAGCSMVPFDCRHVN